MGGYQERVFRSDSEARSAIRRAFRDTNGSLSLSARELGVSVRTLTRYVSKLGLRDELKAMKRGLRKQADAELPKSYAVLGSSLAGRQPSSV